MADFAPNYTGRLRIKYSSGGAVHNMIVRAARGVSDPTGLATKMTAFLTAVKDMRYTDWTLVQADFAPQDTDIFLPVSMSAPAAGTAAIGSTTVRRRANAVSFVGRSDGGTRGMLFLYGTAAFVDGTNVAAADFRIYAGESSVVAAGITALSELSPSLVANDNTDISWYGYVNVKDNDHWVGKLRRG